jgi:hypothetical protein
VAELRQFGRDQLPLFDGVNVAENVERYITQRNGKASSGRREREPGEDDVELPPDPNDPYRDPPRGACLSCDRADRYVRLRDERGELVWRCRCRAEAA